MLYPKDPKVRVERHEKTLKIEWNWGSGGGYIFLVMGLGLLPLFWWAFGQPAINEEVRPLGEHLSIFIPFAILIPGPLILGGLTMLFNKTMIQADHERFIVRVRPFRWMKPILISSREIQQFFVGASGSGEATCGSLYLLDGQSHYVRLSTFFPSRFAAHQICHELQDWYRLEDLPVFGHTDLPHHPGPRLK